MVTYTKLYHWYNEYQRRATDSRCQEFGLLRSQLSQDNRTIEQLLTTSDRGRILAQQLNEPYWYVYFESQYCWDLLHNYRIKEGLDRSVKLFVEIQKPKYHDCPFLIRCYENIVCAYVLYDPVGYATDIFEAADYAINNVIIDLTHHLRILRRCTETYIASEQWEEAKRSGEEYHLLSAKNTNTYHMIVSAIKLCHIAYKLSDDASLEFYVDVALGACTRTPDETLRATILQWQAVLAKQRHQIKEANILSEKSGNLASNPQIGCSDDTLTANFYFSLFPSFLKKIVFEIDTIEMTSPYRKYTKLIREYYAYGHANIWSRWLTLGFEILSPKNEFYEYMIMKSQNIVLGFIYSIVVLSVVFLTGAIGNIIIHPRMRVYHRLLLLAHEMRDPTFYLKRIEQVRKKTGYIP
jgi:hypothetical protein